MADQQTVLGVLEGAFDTHVHSGPDVLPRKFDDVELAERCREYHLGGFVLKSHYVCTADRASLIRQLFPDVQAFGGLVLNNSVGGFNPIAVDIAGRLGTKVVWLPTVDSANELANVAGQKDETKLPYWMGIAREMRAMGIAGPWLSATHDGKVTEALRQCLDLIAKHDMVLATGHIAPGEMLPVVAAARQAGVRRIVVTHPEFPTTLLSIDQQKELARYDVFFERCFTTPNSGKIPWEQVYENIRRVGTSTTILATDLGQSTAPYVDEGLAQFAGRLLDAGFSEGSIRQMAHSNAAELLGARSTASIGGH
ncbi:MAG: cytosolic protein [Chloroflexota bacterium]|nr:cytosolic protein [Chloroflexota bacterium]